MESYQFIPSGGEEILTAYHAAVDGSRPVGCAVLVAPPHEEKKAAHRPLVDLARALANRGCACLRFDPRGTGDSPGVADDLCFGTLRQDLTAAIDQARTLSCAEKISLLGVRLGADLAALEGPASTAVDHTLLCVPLISGERYLREVRIRGKIRGAMTAAEGGDEASGRAAGLDYGGHYVSGELIADLETHDLMADESPLAARVTCMDIRGRDSMTAPLSALVARLRSRGASVDARVVLDEPFWNALGPIVPRAFIQAVVEALTGREDEAR